MVHIHHGAKIKHLMEIANNYEKLNLIVQRSNCSTDSSNKALADYFIDHLLFVIGYKYRIISNG